MFWSLRTLWLILLFFLAVPIITARAQASLEIETLQIDLWPEYDRPDVLVIYHITISATSKLPAQMSLRIPREASAPYNVAMKDVDGMLYNLKYDQAVDGEWLRVSFIASSSEIQIEYYDPRLTRDGNTRQFAYRWPGDYRVTNLQFRLQQPFNATGMQLTNPALKIDGGMLGDDGLTYYLIPVGGVLETGTTLDLPFTYSKPDTALSSSQAPVKPVSTGTNPTTLSSTLLPGGNLLWLGAATVLILGGVIWYWQQHRANGETAPRRGRRHSAKVRSQNAVQVPVNQVIYCHQCGKRAASGDVFCRACGARLRSG